MENLPEDLIMEILLHLPVKSLLRFKCVCKSWFSLISEPYFAKLHFKRSSSQKPNRILYAVGSQLQSIDFNSSLLDDSASVKLNLPLLKPHVDGEIMTASCRGIVFLMPMNNDEHKLHLWNPSTGFHKQIQKPHVNHVVLYGFWYDYSTDDYLVILASVSKWLHGHHPCGLVLGFDLFSTRNNSWQKLEALNDDDEEGGDPLIIGQASYFSSVGSITNGAIHWVVWVQQTAKIIAFDIATKNKLREVPVPDEIECEQGQIMCDVRVLEGCLTMRVYKISREVEIWVMREYGVKSSWRKVMCVASTDHHIIYRVLPLCFSKDGELVALDGHVGLSKWSWEEQAKLIERREYFAQEKTPHRCFCCYTSSCWASVTAYSESLLSLP